MSSSSGTAVFSNVRDRTRRSDFAGAQAKSFCDDTEYRRSSHYSQGWSNPEYLVVGTGHTGRNDACIFTYNSLLLYVKMQTKNRIHGVLIADVIESRSHSHLRSSLNEKLRIASIAQLDDKLVRVPYAVTAGDEFQTIAPRVDSIPKLILDLRRRLQPLQLRIGIGIGSIQGPIRPPVNRIAGQAFEFARAAINQIKETRKYPTLTAFRSYSSELDEIANLVYGLHDTLLRQISAKQWETIAIYLIKNRVDYTAKALSVDISTASRNLKRGYFWQIEHTTAVMESVLGRAFR